MLDLLDLLQHTINLNNTQDNKINKKYYEPHEYSAKCKHIVQRQQQHQQQQHVLITAVFTKIQETNKYYKTTKHIKYTINTIVF